MARIVTIVAVSALQSSIFEGQTLSMFESDIGKGLKGISKDTDWTGEFFNFAGGLCINHLSGDAGDTTFTGSNTRGFWFKNTGFRYDSTLPNRIDYSVTVTGGVSIGIQGAPPKFFCKILPGGGIFLPTSNQVYRFAALDEDPEAGFTYPALEYIRFYNA